MVVCEGQGCEIAWKETVKFETIIPIVVLETGYWILSRGHLIANSQPFQDFLGNFKSRKLLRIRGFKIQYVLRM